MNITGKRIQIRYVIFFLAALITGCQDNNLSKVEAGRSVVKLDRNISGNPVFQEALLQNDIQVFSSDMVIHDGNIIIASNGGKLISMTMNGEINWALNRKGSGPGEFHYPIQLQIHDDTIGIYNNERDRVHLFSTSGDHIKDVQLQDSIQQFDLVNGKIHVFLRFDGEYLFASYDVETGDRQKYGKRKLLQVLPDKVTPDNFRLNSYLLQADESSTVAALVHYAQILVYDREADEGVVLDLSAEKEIKRSMALYDEQSKNFSKGEMVMHHFLDLTKVGDHFCVTLAGPWGEGYANYIRFTPEGQIYDKVYRLLDESNNIGGLDNLTLLDGDTYFGYEMSQSRFLLVTISEKVRVND